MSKGCPYPHCILSDWHDGEHDDGKDIPRGQLVKMQDFETQYQRCDLCPELPARAFYQDGNGRGWALCGFCIDEYLGRESVAA